MYPPLLMKSSEYVGIVIFQRLIMKLLKKELGRKKHQSSLFHVHTVDNVDDTQKQVTGRLPWQQQRLDTTARDSTRARLDNSNDCVMP